VPHRYSGFGRGTYTVRHQRDAGGATCSRGADHRRGREARRYMNIRNGLFPMREYPLFLLSPLPDYSRRCPARNGLFPMREYPLFLLSPLPGYSRRCPARNHPPALGLRVIAKGGSENNAGVCRAKPCLNHFIKGGSVPATPVLAADDSHQDARNNPRITASSQKRPRVAVGPVITARRTSPRCSEQSCVPSPGRPRFYVYITACPPCLE
jgi:hypothetical protein